MKIQLVDTEDNYIIEIIDIDDYDLDDDRSIEQLRETISDIIIEYHTDL